MFGAIVEQEAMSWRPIASRRDNTVNRQIIIESRFRMMGMSGTTIKGIAEYTLLL